MIISNTLGQNIFFVKLLKKNFSFNLLPYIFLKNISKLKTKKNILFFSTKNDKILLRICFIFIKERKKYIQEI